MTSSEVLGVSEDGAAPGFAVKKGDVPAKSGSSVESGELSHSSERPLSSGTERAVACSEIEG